MCCQLDTAYKISEDKKSGPLLSFSTNFSCKSLQCNYLMCETLILKKKKYLKLSGDLSGRSRGYVILINMGVVLQSGRTVAAVS